MPLHLDYRPKELKDIVGNKPTVLSLESILAREDRPHSYLFSGPAGCGKTTLARILADKLGCKTDHDLTEINMSNNRGIDTARFIIDSTRYRPLAGEVKVYLMDEVHKATNDFQNAILKVLEEPPSFVYFILCTTEPEKLLPTVISRCSSFGVSLLPTHIMSRFIKHIVNKEGIKLAESILDKLVAHVNGCPRQALIFLDQVRDMKGDEESILECMQIIVKEEKQVIDLCRALLDQKTGWEKVASILKGIEAEPEKVRLAVLGYMGQVLLKGKKNDQAFLVLECFKSPFYTSGKAGLVGACYDIYS